MSQPVAVKSKPATAYTSPQGGVGSAGDQTRKANEVIKPESSNAQSASLSQLFSQAEPIDILYMVLGTFGSMVTGVSLPIFNILFGQMLDSLNKKGVGGYQDAVNQVCISFVIVAAANVVAGAMQVYFWSAAGERQTQRFREKYVRSILSQEIGWFDTCGASELSTKVADLTGSNTPLIHDDVLFMNFDNPPPSLTNTHGTIHPSSSLQEKYKMDWVAKRRI